MVSLTRGMDGPIKLSHEEHQDYKLIDIREEYKECENKNDDGLCVESVRLSGAKINKRPDLSIDKIHEYAEILIKMSMPEDILKEMSLETRSEINSVMSEISDKIIAEAESLKKSLFYV